MAKTEQETTRANLIKALELLQEVVEAWDRWDAPPAWVVVEARRLIVDAKLPTATPPE